MYCYVLRIHNFKFCVVFLVVLQINRQCLIMCIVSTYCCHVLSADTDKHSTNTIFTACVKNV